MNYEALFTGLIGALLGAGIAFGSDMLKAWMKRRNEQHGAIVRTQLALIGQFDTINSLHDQFLDRLRNDPERAAKLIRFGMEPAQLRVDYNSISFMLVTDHAQLILEIQAAEQSYFSTMELLASRNAAYDKLHANTKIESFDLKTGQCRIVAEDPRHMALLKYVTDSLYVTADTARERLSVQIKEVLKAGKTLFPKKTFLRIEGRKLSQQNQSSDCSPKLPALSTLSGAMAK